MQLTFEDVELLARLEIEVNLASEELSNLVERMQRVCSKNIEEEITVYFLEGVRYGITADDSTTAFDAEVELLQFHSNRTGNTEKTEIEEMVDEYFLKLFSFVFATGVQWSIQHRLFNEEN